jgi:hypothetical protein
LEKILRDGAGTDIFADAGHLESFAGDEIPTFEAEMADVFSIETEASAVFEEVFRMALCEFVQAAVALEIFATLAAAGGIDIAEQTGGERVVGACGSWH